MRTQHSVLLASGVRLPYARLGAGKGAPVVLLHGIADTWRSYELVLDALPDRLDVVAPTQRGHSGASCPSSGYRLSDYANDLADLLDALKLDRPVIVGHSMGSAVALRFVAENPDRALGLVLVSAPMVKPADPKVRAFVKDVVSKLSDPVDPEFVREFATNMVAGAVSPGFMEARVQESMRLPARVWREAFEARLEEDLTEAARSVSVPTLLVRGGLDERATESDMAALHRAIPDSQTRTYEGAGHCLHWEQPARFASDLTEFAARIEPSG